MRTWPIALVALWMAAVTCAAKEPDQRPDLSTPTAAAKSLFHAVSSGDRDQIREALYSPDESQKPLTAAMADVIVAGKDLGDAARDRFGQADNAIGAGMLDPANLQKIEQAEVKLDGDRATLIVPGQPRPMSFRRGADGNWRLVVAAPSSVSGESLAMQTKLMSQMAQAFSECAGEIRSGKFATPADAQMAIQSRLHAVMTENYKPASQPLTSPASRPATAPDQ